MRELKAGDAVLVPGKVVACRGLVDRWVRVAFREETGETRCVDVLAADLTVQPEKLPTKVGSIVLIKEGPSRGEVELVLIKPVGSVSIWLPLTRDSFQENYTPNDIEQLGFSVVWDRGAESNGA